MRGAAARRTLTAMDWLVFAVFVVVYDIGWREHARVGVPVTLVTLAVAASWLWLR